MRGRQREMVVDWRKEVGGVRRTKNIKQNSVNGWRKEEKEQKVCFIQ